MKPGQTRGSRPLPKPHPTLDSNQPNLNDPTRPISLLKTNPNRTQPHSYLYPCPNPVPAQRYNPVTQTGRAISDEPDAGDGPTVAGKPSLPFFYLISPPFSTILVPLGPVWSPFQHTRSLELEPFILHAH